MISSKHVLWLMAAAWLVFSTGRSTAQTWNGGGTNDNWSTAGNWTGGAPANPFPGAGTANVFFDGILRLTPNIDAPWNINSLTFNATAGAFTIGGQQLFLEAGITDNSTSTQIIMAPLKLGVAASAMTFTTVSGGNLVIGDMDWYGVSLTVGGAGNTLFSGVGTDTGPGASLIKNGTGTLTMTNVNAYTGGTTVNAGTLIIGANNALGTAGGATTVANGATLGIQGGITYSTAEAVTIRGTGVGGVGAINNVSGTNSFAGPITLAAASTIGSSAGLLTLGGAVTNGGFLLRVNGAGDVTMTNRISGTGGLTKNGSGTLTLSASNTYTGATTINPNGTLIVTANSALGTTAGGTTVNNGGTLGFQGGVTYNTKEGVRIFGVGATNAGRAGAIDNVGGTNSFAGPITLGSASTIGSSAGLLTLGGAVTNGGFLLTVNSTGGNVTMTSRISGTGGLTKNGSGTLTLSGATANTYSGMTRVNDGTLVLSKTAGVNAFAGALTVGDGVGGLNADIARLGANNQIPGAVTILNSGWLDLNNFSDTITTLTMTGGNITTGTGTLTLGGNVVGNADANTATIGGKLALGTATRTFTIASGAASPGMSISAVVSGIVGLTKNGAGVLVLSGNNTYSGATTVNAGTLVAAANNALGTTVGATTVANGATLGIQGGITYSTAEAVTIRGVGVGGVGAINNVSGTNSFAGPITLAAASTIGTTADQLTLSGNIGGNFLLTVTNAPGTTAVLSGVRSGTGGLTKNGSGTLTLSGATANTYSGMTRVNDGTLVLSKTAGVNAFAGALTVGDGVGGLNADIARLGANNQIPGAVTILNSGWLDLNNFSDTITTLTMTGGNITTGTGTLTLGGNVVGNADANTATIGGELALGTVTRTFTIASGAASPGMSISAVVSGTGGLTKNGTGVLVLSGNNTYSGATTVNAGTLVAAANNALGTTGGATTVANGATLGIQGGITYSTAEAVTIRGVGVGGVGAINNVSGTNSFAGPITLAAASTIGTTADQLTLSGNIGGNFLLTVTNAPGTTAVLNGVRSGTGGLTKNGTGTLILSAAAANTFTGATTVNAGTLNLASAGALGSTSAVTLNTGGTLLLSGAPTANRIKDTAGLALAGGTLEQNGATETMGVLTLTANSVINLGAAGGLTFANTTWSPGAFTLTVNGWTGTSGIGGSSTGATLSFSSTMSGQVLNNINFTGYAWGGYVLSTGEIIPVPEPASILAGLLLVSLLGWQSLRRFFPAAS